MAMIFEGTTGDEYSGRVVAGDVALAIKDRAVLDDDCTGFGVASAITEEGDVSTLGNDVDIALTGAGDWSVAEDIDAVATFDVDGFVAVADENHGRRWRWNADF